MLASLSIFHFVICVFLVLLVSVQDSKEGVGIFSGGSSSQSMIGHDADTFLTKLTKWVAIVFSVTCIVLTYITSQKNKSVLEDLAPTSAPQAPQKPGPTKAK